MARLKRVTPHMEGDRRCPACQVVKDMDTFIGYYGYYVSTCEQCRDYKKLPIIVLSNVKLNGRSR